MKRTREEWDALAAELQRKEEHYESEAKEGAADNISPDVAHWMEIHKDIVQIFALRSEFPDDVDYGAACIGEVHFDSMRRNAHKVIESLPTSELKAAFLTALYHAFMLAISTGKLDEYSANKRRRAAGKDRGSGNQGSTPYPLAKKRAAELFAKMSDMDRRSLTAKATAIGKEISKEHARDRVDEPTPSPNTIYNWLKNRFG